MLDATDDAILVIDPQQGKIIDANQRVYEIFGYSPAEIIDQPISSLGNMVEAYSLKKVYRWAARVRREGAQVMEWQARRKNGHQFWVEISLRYESIGKKIALSCLHDFLKVGLSPSSPTLLPVGEGSISPSPTGRGPG